MSWCVPYCLLTATLLALPPTCCKTLIKTIVSLAHLLLLTITAEQEESGLSKDNLYTALLLCILSMPARPRLQESHQS